MQARIDDRPRIGSRTHLASSDRVEDRGADVARGLRKLVVRLELDSGLELLRLVARERGLRRDPAGEPQGVGGDLPVFGRRQVARVDRRVRAGIGTLYAHVAATRRAEVAHRGGDRRERVQRIAELVERERLDVILDVRGRLRRVALREAAELARRHGERTGAAERVLEPHRRLAPEARGTLVHRHGVLHLERHAELEVVLEVLPDAPQIVRDRDAVLLQQRRRPDSGELKDLWRADRPGREDCLDAPFGEDVLAAASELDAGGPPAVEPEPVHVYVRHDSKVGTAHRRFEESLRRAPAHAPALVHLEERGALVVAAVEVLHLRNARLRHRLAEGVEHVPRQPLPLDAPFAAGRVHVARATVVVLRALEDRQHARPRPRAVAGDARPLVVVTTLAAEIQHRVDRRAAAEDLAARVEDRAPVEPRIGLGAVAPVGARIADAVQVADRDVDPDPVVLAARLEQQDRHVRVRGQPVREHAAGGACADDDVVPRAERLHYSASSGTLSVVPDTTIPPRSPGTTLP